MVCVVDDDPDLLAALRFALGIDGYAVRDYPSAEALLAEIGSAADAACLILDQILSRLAGLDLLVELRRHGIATPAILITTHPKAPLRARAAQLGVRIVEKPLLGDALAHAVREEIGGRYPQAKA